MSASTEPDTAFKQDGFVPLDGSSGTVGASVEVDENETSREADCDSSISTGQSSATTSLSSSIFSFTYANGRRYHSDSFKVAEYFLPNDEAEQDRLDLYHHIFLSMLGGKLYIAPVDKPQRVLDVGTGTGLWAIDFADENPQAEIIGTDISPIQPSWVPPNVKFEVEDMEDAWTFPDSHFDFIHMRSLCGAFSNWDKVLKQAFKKTAPGGYVEYQDYACQMYLSDGTYLDKPSDEHPLASYFFHVNNAAAEIGRPLTVACQMKEFLEKAGFIDVVAQKAIWPLGSWPKDKRLKELGKWCRMGATDSFYPFGLHLLTKVGWSIEQIKDISDKTGKSLHKGKYYTYGWFVYGRKPEEKCTEQPDHTSPSS